MTAPTVDRDTAERAKPRSRWSSSLNGFCFATLVSRLPDIRERPRPRQRLPRPAAARDRGRVGAGAAVQRPADRAASARPRWCGSVPCWSLVRPGRRRARRRGGRSPSVATGALASSSYGVGTGVWDVSMNVEGAEVERRLGRTIMPRFHAGWSIGSIVGAGVGIDGHRASRPAGPALSAVGALALVALVAGVPAFLAAEPDEDGHADRRRSAWLRAAHAGDRADGAGLRRRRGRPPTTGSRSPLIDGYDAGTGSASLGFALFVTAMTAGRLAGPPLLDRYGRAPVLWATSAAARSSACCSSCSAATGAGRARHRGLGPRCLAGLPGRHERGRRRPRRAAARVCVVSTIGYSAFLAGPPLLGLLADQVGTLEALLVLAVLMVPAALTVFAARPSSRGPQR